MSNKLFLFPDTNIFLQCKPLVDIDFSEISDCDEIVIIISRPVQQEIDRQKGKGTSRLSKKAKNAATLFSRVLESPDMTLVIKENSPRVLLTMDLRLRPAEELADQLDYQEADDRFVGIAAGFRNTGSEFDVAIITNDSGPRFSAIDHGIKCFTVPSSWMLAAETDEKDKQIQQLKAQLDLLSKTRPDFVINADNGEQFESTHPYYTSLTEEEISFLVSVLTNEFPLETDFSEGEGQSPYVRLPGSLRAIDSGRYIPASEDEIEHYKNVLYPEWVKKCEEILRDCHEHLNPLTMKQEIGFWLQNTGYAIAESSVITFSAKGAFALSSSDWKMREDLEEVNGVNLPAVPSAPKGRWESVWSLAERGPLATAIPFHDMYRMPRDSFLPPSLSKRNRNDFYYSNQGDSPKKYVSLECEEWRHQVDREWFSFFAYVGNHPTEMIGAVEVRIDANNLPQPITKTFTIKIKIEETDSFALVREMITAYIREQREGTKKNSS
ncbi:PIN domain-containing protein [Enterobacter asburiae]|uniref:PIN domain-containing protein n=1 Tax=Enterobacter asburiae TaxID=61645 RepID=UPI000F8684C6|nr:PIN domain-containing protein [Enterobacter asburiae]RTP91517.1 DNA-binding protein [Enterobacter asburiae]